MYMYIYIYIHIHIYTYSQNHTSIQQVYLRMSRVDVAEKSLSLMSRMEDDATLTQLTTAWVSMALGGCFLVFLKTDFDCGVD